MPLADFRHRIALRVRWAEVDMQGVVFNGHYLAYCDIAVTEYWRALGLHYPQDFLAAGGDTFVRRATLDYLAPARFDDQLTIACRTARLGRTSLQLLLEIHRDGPDDALLTGCELIYVHAEPASLRPLPWREGLRQRVRAFEVVHPVEALDRTTGVTADGSTVGATDEAA
jgi:acyl-CoA thioester hydrolase